MFWLRAKGENRECLDCPVVDKPTSMAIMSEGIGFDDRLSALMGPPFKLAA